VWGTRPKIGTAECQLLKHSLDGLSRMLTSMPNAQLDLDTHPTETAEDVPTHARIGGRQYRVSKVFWAYWKFAVERQAVFFRRLRGLEPWTDDPIIKAFKFTNPYRASDRVSQYMIREVAYRGEQTCNEIFFRIILFKLFNKIETWELLKAHVGDISFKDYRYEQYDSVLSKALDSGRKIYSAAYIMPSGGSSESRKHRVHLALLDKMMRDEAPSRISDVEHMVDAFKLLRSYRGIGDFLSYQFVTDLNYSTLCNFGEMDFVMPGPGAKDGIRKCFPEIDIASSAEMIRLVAETQEEHFKTVGQTFVNLWGRSLKLIDCQNLFCEVDKYSRSAHPDILGISGRTRIKQRYRPSPLPLKLFYPPKWGINELIPADLRAACA